MPSHGTPPRAVFPDPPGVLPYARSLPMEGWRVSPYTWVDHIAWVARAAGVVALIASLFFAAINYDEYDRATRRLAQPFNEPNATVAWSTPAYVTWRRDESLASLRYCAYAAGSGAVVAGLGFAREWHRRRRLRR